MAKITIDNKELEFKSGQTILQIAKEAGIKIPHFCWHPGLSISGNCRICLVEIEKFPKLAIACSTQAMEGMIVHTKSEKVVKAQNSVMEFLLINHPLDCPICDEAGECKLQDYAYKYSTGQSRFDEEKNHKDKRIPLGPNVMFDQERCISCSRCIRFCDEIAKEPQLTFINRGEKVTITTFPGKELDNPYSMNVIEICPVGALTSRHFRFKSRVWDMSFTDSICPGCSRGCNTIIGVRNNEILRIEPRQNLDVNEYWLCDWGRLNTFKYINDEKQRVITPTILSEETDEHIEVSWDEAISRTSSELNNLKGEILFIASPFSTLEDNYTLKKFAKEIFKSENITYIPNIDESFEDDLLKKADKTPNSNGLRLLGINPITEKHIENLKEGKYKIIYLINDDITRIPEVNKFLKKVDISIHHLNIKNNYSDKATVVFPESTYAEINGTFVNFQNHVQRIKPAVVTLEQERLIGEYSISRLDKFGAPNDSWSHGTRFNARPTWKVLTKIAKSMGYDFNFETSEDVFIELCNSIPGMKGWDYDTLGSKGKKI
ncbi:MAG: 2Fe-2S iron-sulfur cluster-binding protein [Ignavibacteriae bacterium]|nr:2Fe-2S iron-sulfur cluster-binding protein [Ignavibacteriota bacterium]